MKEIILTQGKVAIVDDEDFEYLSQWKWFAKKSNTKWYACRTDNKKSSHRCIRMHREVIAIEFFKGDEVDHINGNSLDNRKSNLRVLTTAQNQRNVEKHKKEGMTSKYKGVSYSKTKEKWIATIRLGTFNSEEDAAEAFNKAAIMLFSDVARLNETS